MELHTEDIWVTANSALRVEVSPMSYDTWIKPLLPVTIKEGTIYLEAPNEPTRNMLTSRYMKTLEQTIEAAAGQHLDVKVTLPGESPPRGDARILNPKYTFDTFVVGQNNRFAHAAALAVAELPGEAYNPLFLYGGVGLGKTHLMHAIGQMILDEHPSRNILYVTSETFTNELITAIMPSRTNQEYRTSFRSKYRNVDVLLIDDIQFIGGKESTMEEFFHTFNTLHEAGKQIVISADKPPRELTTMEDRLRSRFQWGLIADIQRPDFETRVSILRRKAELENFHFENDEVLSYIATRFEDNVRELEGSLTKVRAIAHLDGTPITMAMVEDALREMVADKDPKHTPPDAIIGATCAYFGVSRQEITGQRRNREIVVPRQVAMYLLRDMIDMSQPSIGTLFGGRDHTTVLHAVNKIEREMLTDRRLQTALTDIRKRILEP